MIREDTSFDWDKASEMYLNPDMKRMFLFYRRHPGQKLKEFDRTATPDEKLKMANMYREEREKLTTI